MNLIERLAGYGECERLRAVPAASSFRIRGIEFTREELERAMLEHRRQHNIFEESDKIVFIDDFMHGELMTVAWTRKGEVWMDEGAKRCTDLSMIRHATDEEIAAGRRL